MRQTQTEKRKELERKMLLLREKKIRSAKTNFYDFCRAINPGFFKLERTYLKRICDTFQAIFEGTLINEKTGKPYKKVTLSVPPGHGKSYTASLFSMWCFGQDNKNQIISVSYNEKMSGRFARTVRDSIESEKGKMPEIVFSDVFPDTKVKYGDASVQNWSLEGQYMSYLATSFKASLTGMRGNIGIIDDPIKNAEEAYNEQVLTDKWDWYRDTFLSRMLEGGIQIVIATRWSTEDLIGKLLNTQPDEWYEMNLPALQDKETKTMLCDSILKYETYLERMKLTSPGIFFANYDQKPVNEQGRLYTTIKTYDHIPKDEEGNALFEAIINYTDTADEGSDFLASGCAGVYQGQLYLIDILYTKDGMEKTEPATAKMLYDNAVGMAMIESNNGGRGFARSVERILWDHYKTRRTAVNWFHQSKNKKARILSNATNVMSNIYFPVNWRERWPEFYKSITGYQREGKNKNDDGPDMLTGLVEMIENKPRIRTL